MNTDNILDRFTPDGRFAHEHNDCVVSALCNVTDESYGSVWHLLKRNGRKDRHGFKTIAFIGAQREFLGHRFTRIGPDTRRPNLFYCVHPTVRTFARQHPNGKYLICIAHHALMVDQGCIVDSARARPLGRIRAAWKVEKI